MRKRRQILFMVLSLVLWTVPAFATFTPIYFPNAAYLAQTTYIDFSAVPDTTSPDYLSLNSINDGFLTIGFGSPMYKLSVPDSWATWSEYPFSQQPSTVSPLPVLRTDTIDLDNLPDAYIQSITMTLSHPVNIFGFEAEPDIYDAFYWMTASFYNEGGTLLGKSKRLVVAWEDFPAYTGARLFAASSTDPIASVQFSIQTIYPCEDKTPFAVGAFRYSVPEPTTMLLLGFGLIGLAGFRRKF
jgi:hypothetical protein